MGRVHVSAQHRVAAQQVPSLAHDENRNQASELDNRVMDVSLRKSSVACEQFKIQVGSSILERLHELKNGSLDSMICSKHHFPIHKAAS